MKISLNWLARYVDAPLDADGVAERVTLAGFPVDHHEPVGADHLLDVEVTWNRPDCQSHVGVAREVAGLAGVALKLPAPALPALSSDRIDVSVDAPDLCPVYTARVIRGVRVGPSPPWLVELLQTVGQRSVNNVVDITNYVLLECGQPLHAFDLAKLRGPVLGARRAAGETMVAIDGTRLTLGAEDLAIVDAAGPVALAGVMGGLETEVGDATTDIVLECALFAPLAIRETSRRHRIRSESSFRFERFVDGAAMDRASDRAAALLVELAGAEAVGPICRAGPGATEHAAEITLRTAQIARVLGVPVSEEEARGILSSLGMVELTCGDEAATRWRAPSWRPDLVQEIDLVEEVARRVGFDRVPDEVRIPVRPAYPDPQANALRRVRETLAACGLRECCTAPFVGEGAYDQAFLTDRPALRVENPMRAEEALLRRCLLGPLLRVARGNVDRGVTAYRFFEIAHVYLRGETDPATTDMWQLGAVLVTGRYADVKGFLEVLLDALHLEGRTSVERRATAPFDPSASAVVRLDGEVIGHLGELDRTTLRATGLTGPVTALEIRVDRLVQEAQLQREYRPVSRFPGLERDLDVVVEERVTWAALATAVREAAGALLARLEPIDVYRDARIGAGRKSVTLRMELRAPDRTLTGDEAEACVNAVLARIGAAIGGTLRG